jgi:hypothetical protein
MSSFGDQGVLGLSALVPRNFEKLTVYDVPVGISEDKYFSRGISMATIKISKLSKVGDLLIAEGTVNDVPVKSEGWMSAMTGKTKPQKTTYVESLLSGAAPPEPVDVVL